MNEKPILFSSPMILAILDGCKTQTRRVVKPTQSTPKVAPLRMEPWLIDGEQETDDDGLPCWAGYHPDYPGEAKWFSCPYGGVDHQLWVREAAIPDFPKEFSYYDWTWAEVPEEYRSPRYVQYRATFRDPETLRWHPSIHMPRWASRITLRITDVRVERLQEITDNDALAEGITGVLDDGIWSYNGHVLPRDGFADLWDSINGKGYPWTDNPFVWVVSFERVKDAA